MGCPDEPTLQLFSRGDLSGAEATPLRDHISACAHCQARLEAASQRATGTGTATSALHVTPLPVDGPPITRGTPFDRYVILDRVGAGGMGVVYSAFDPKLDRKIALKLLPAGEAQGASSRARLLREAQAMARLSHPNVVAIYDAGEVEGQVFIAMELIDGRTLRQWLAERPRTWREIVQTYVAAGHGLEAAHAVEIVHRDFKPGNVLIGADGRARVMDFGVARLSQVTGEVPVVPPSSAVAAAASSEPVTQAGVVVGTLAYMAPEQMSGAATDARTDQYAFAVSLYEGLYGEKPFDPKAQGDARWLIRPAPRAAQVPAWVRRALLVALEKDPGKRYPSMARLIEALERDPWVARRRWLFAAGGLAAAAVAVLAFEEAGTQQALLCTGAERQLDGVWDDLTRAKVDAALRASDKPFAPASAASVRSVLDGYARGWAQMHREACEATRLRGEQPETVLAARMACLDQRLQELSALTRLYATEGTTVIDKAVRAAQALSPLAGCADLKLLTQGVKPPPDATTAEAVVAVRARLAAAKVLQDSGRLKASLDVAVSAAADAERSGYRPVQAEAKLLHGTLLMRTGDGKGAEQVLFAAYTTADGAGHDVIAAEAASREVGLVGYMLARYDDGERWGQLAQARIDRMGGNDAVEAKLQNNLAVVAHARARYDEAVGHYRLALSLREKTIGRDHPETADTLSNIGVLLGEMGRFDESEALLAEALKNREKALGLEHQDLVQHLINHASTLLAMGRVEAAEAELRRGISLCEKGYGVEHPFYGELAAALGEAFAVTGRWAEALEEDQRALAVREKAYGPEHPGVAAGLISAGNCQVALGRPKEALEPLARALRIAEAAQGATHPQVAEALTALGRAHVGLGDPRKGLPELERAVAILKSATGGAERARVDALLGLAEAQAATAPELAVGTLEEAVKVSATARVDQRAAALRALAQAVEQKDPVRAQQLEDQATAVLAAGGVRP